MIVQFKKRVIKQLVKEAKQKSKILAILNEYKNMLDNFIHSLHIKFLKMLYLNKQKCYNPMP